MHLDHVVKMNPLTFQSTWECLKIVEMKVIEIVLCLKILFPLQMYFNLNIFKTMCKNNIEYIVGLLLRFKFM